MLTGKLRRLSSNAVISASLKTATGSVSGIRSILRGFSKYRKMPSACQQFAASLSRKQAAALLNAKNEEQQQVSVTLGKPWQKFMLEVLLSQKNLWPDFLRIYKTMDSEKKIAFLKSIDRDLLREWLEKEGPTVADILYRFRHPCSWDEKKARQRSGEEADIFYALMEHAGFDFLKNHLTMQDLDKIVQDYYFKLHPNPDFFNDDPLYHVPADNYWRFIKPFLSEKQLVTCEAIGKKPAFQLLTGRFDITGSSHQKLGNMLAKMTPEQQRLTLDFIGGRAQIEKMVRLNNDYMSMAASASLTSLSENDLPSVDSYINSFPEASRTYLAEEEMQAAAVTKTRLRA